MKETKTMTDGQFFQWSQNLVLEAPSPEKVRKAVTSVIKATIEREEFKKNKSEREFALDMDFRN